MSDPTLEELLAEMGLQRHTFAADLEKNKPYTRAGIPSMRYENQLMGMSDNISGGTVGTLNGRDSAVLYNPKYVNNYVRAHEYEHVLANQGLGRSSKINTKFDELVGGEDARETRRKLVERLIANATYLKQHWGLQNESYFTPEAAKEQGPLAPNLLYEQLASLSAMEQKKGKRLVDDKYIRDNVLTTPAQREAYDAVTGLRQTRLDARDLPPYTKQAEVSTLPKTPTKKSTATDAIIKRFMDLMKR